MTICYYSFYQGEGRVSKIGMVLYVDHKKQTFRFHINAPVGKYPNVANYWVCLASNQHMLTLYDALKKDGYKEVEHTFDPHPWTLTNKENKGGQKHG